MAIYRTYAYRPEPHSTNPKVRRIWTERWLKYGCTRQINASQENRAECK